ncbi:glycerophosphodiester phosphodiesterase family protein [Variovorax sp. J22G73]|uniref:glycerophosphodiester phosphodiesterase family protein n=1 Tax=unclassified Variovorax TaxID=663243 RepID=UPI002575004B|nr:MULTISPECIES: glycerophosphodiester phosphodiesterase family protein [unclassified Variovorax]MDM0008234.1 glycerophosphodiester phosphodiesterase family protein [Variovorax sp. J22R203]MDM0100740.1 glycerophosphodiester phosphodiesterase family protein [Variovorax sp. J22G73]
MTKKSTPAPAPRPVRAAFAALGGCLVIAACGGGNGNGNGIVFPVLPPAPAPAPAPAPMPSPLGTLDGSVPLVIGHRGLPGLYPEETKASYEAAADAGADSLETDLHLTKDCVLVARHNPWLSDNTNVVDVAKTNATVAGRKRTVPPVLVDVKYPPIAANGPAKYNSDLTDPADPKSVLKSLVVDGEDHTNDWSITDFTMDELRQWIRGTTYDAKDQRPTDLNGKLPILSFQEVIDIAKAKSASTGRALTVYPETKNPIWNNAQAIANGCGPVGSHPLEDALLKIMNFNDLNRKDAPIFVQSFEPESLKYLRSAGLKARAVQLVDGNDVNYQTGEMIYVTNDVYTFVDGRPYSWTLAGNPKFFGEMLTPAGLAEVKTYADGIGPWKPQVMLHTIVPFATPNKGLADVNTIKPTALIADAHKAGLFVHSYTFRNEAKYLAGVYKGDPTPEYLAYFRAGIDGVFSDFANTAFAARQAYLKETGR